MGYKNKTNLEYQREFYAKNKLIDKIVSIAVLFRSRATAAAGT